MKDKSGSLLSFIGVGTVTIKTSTFFKEFISEVNFNDFILFNIFFEKILFLSKPLFKSITLFLLISYAITFLLNLL